MRPTTSLTIHAILAAALVALAASSAAAGPAYLKFEPIKGDSNAAPARGDIEVLSYSWGQPQAAGRVSKVDSFTVKQGVKPEQGGEKGGTEDINIGVGELQENAARAGSGGGQGSGKVSVHDISTNSAKPAAKGTVWVRVASPWAGCRVGDRYPSITLSEGAKSHVLHDVSVANCGNAAAGASTEEVAFYYNRIAFNY